MDPHDFVGIWAFFLPNAVLTTFSQKNPNFTGPLGGGQKGGPNSEHFFLALLPDNQSNVKGHFSNFLSVPIYTGIK